MRAPQGVAIGTVTDVQRTAVGSALAIAAVVTTCLSQLYTRSLSHRERHLALSPPQLLHAVAPAMSVVMLALGVPLDLWLLRRHPVAAMHRCGVRAACGAVAIPALSCLLAAAVNLSTFQVIGACEAGPVTYQVLGHAKSIVHVLAWMLLARRRDAHTARTACGAAIAALGLLAYSRAAVRTLPQVSEQALRRLLCSG